MQFGSFQDFLESGAGIDIRPDAVLSDAHDLMLERMTSILIVVGDGTFCGVISECDILRHVSQHGGLTTVQVQQIMRRDVEWVTAKNLRHWSRPIV